MLLRVPRLPLLPWPPLQPLLPARALRCMQADEGHSPGSEARLSRGPQGRHRKACKTGGTAESKCFGDMVVERVRRNGQGHGTAAWGNGEGGGGQKEKNSYFLCIFVHHARCLVYIYLSYCSLITVNEVTSNRTEDKIH